MPSHEETHDSSSVLSFVNNARWRLYTNMGWGGVILILLIPMLFATTIVGPPVWSGTGIQQLLQNWVMIALIIPPMALIIATGEIDLSVGTVAGLVGTLIAVLVTDVGTSSGVAFAVGVVVAVLIGIVNAILVSLLRIHGALVTFAMWILLRGLSSGIAGPQGIRVAEVEFFSALTLPVVVLVLLLSIAVVFVTEVLPVQQRLQVTTPGASFSQRLLHIGIPYMLSSMLAGITGALLLGRLGFVDPFLGFGIESQVILAVVLGGTVFGMGVVNILGALVVALFPPLIRNIVVFADLPMWVFDSVIGFLILFAVVIGRGYIEIVNRLWRKPRSLPQKPPL